MADEQSMQKKFKPMRGIVARTGGKSRLRKTIIPLIPDHERYVELFMIFLEIQNRSEKR